MNEKISVLMGVYNAEQVVGEAVRTIEDQTEKNIEFVICDDGSTDRTYALLTEFQQQYGNIVLLHNEQNSGLAYSLNRCLEHSTGEYIARMDADDSCVPERFEKQKQFLQAHPEYDLVGAGMIMVDDNGVRTYSHDVPEPYPMILPVSVPFSHPTVLMRRYVLERLGGYSVEHYTRRCEDLELWYRFFALGMRGYNMPEYLYIKKQGLEDYKRRKVIFGWEMFYIHLRGLRLLHAPFPRYLLAIKPVISAMVPKKIMMRYHGWKFRGPESRGRRQRKDQRRDG